MAPKELTQKIFDSIPPSSRFFDFELGGFQGRFKLATLGILLPILSLAGDYVVELQRPCSSNPHKGNIVLGAQQWLYENRTFFQGHESSIIFADYGFDPEKIFPKSSDHIEIYCPANTPWGNFYDRFLGVASTSSSSLEYGFISFSEDAFDSGPCVFLGMFAHEMAHLNETVPSHTLKGSSPQARTNKPDAVEAFEFTVYFHCQSQTPDLTFEALSQLGQPVPFVATR